MAQTICDNCKGTGKADKHDYIGFAEHAVSKVECPRCQGTGKVGQKDGVKSETTQTNQ